MEKMFVRRLQTMGSTSFLAATEQDATKSIGWMPSLSAG
jgi:hypothetical protein